MKYLPRILPGVDEQVATEAKKIFEKQGLTFRLGTKVTSVTAAGKTCTIQMEGAEPITCDRVLIAVGRKPCTDNLGLADAGVQTDKRGFIQVNAGYQTTATGVYAVGDVIGGAMLAHKAEEEGIACIEKMATGHSHINYGTIPAVIYTQPEIGFFSEFSGCIRGGMKVDFLIIRDANQGACESDALADSECGA